MKKVIFTLLVLCSTALIFTSCCRCKKAEEEALLMPKDSQLVGTWKKIITDPLMDPHYLIFQADGIMKEGRTPDSINTSDVWYTIDGYLYKYYCGDMVNPRHSKDRYWIENDTLILQRYGKDPATEEGKRRYVRIIP